MFSENASASLRDGASATRYGCTEDIGVVPVVVAELKLRNVKRQIFSPNFVECAHDAALDERPKAVDCLSVDRADNVFATTMPNVAMRELFEPEVGRVFVGREQINLGRYRFTNEALQRCGIGVADHASDHVALPANSASNDLLADATRALDFLVPMPVAVLAPT